MTLSIRALVSGLVVALATGVTTLAQSPTPAAYGAEEPANRSLDATLYMQTAAEYRASCYQAYNVAFARLEALVKEKKESATKPFAVVMDLDETVLDNSQFQAMLLKNGLAWNKGLWDIWEKDHSADVTLIPGAKEFIDKIKVLEEATRSSVDVFYVSNRSEDFRKQAVDALTALKVAPKDDHLRLKKGKKDWKEGDPDPTDKTERFDQIRAQFEVLLYIGDNLKDFQETLGFGSLNGVPEGELNARIEARKALVDAPEVRGSFGTNWVILPNPTYGEWKAPLGKGEKDFDRLRAANFPIPPALPSPSPSNSPPKKCVLEPGSHSHNIDPAIWAALIGFASAAALFFWRKWLERESINRAVLAEIQRILTVVEEHRKWWDKRVNENDTNYPLIPFSHVVYSKQIANIGALKNRLVAKVVKFYGYLDFINSLQAARPAYADDKKRKFDEKYLATLTRFLRDHKNAFESPG